MLLVLKVVWVQADQSVMDPVWAVFVRVGTAVKGKGEGYSGMVPVAELESGRMGETPDAHLKAAPGRKKREVIG
jgi:hypothetical protein